MTFTIVNEYLGERDLIHFDMYRLSGAEELFDIGWEDYLRRGAVCAVEWSEKVSDAFFGDEIRVRLEKRGDTERAITIEGAELCNALAQEIPEEKQNERGYLANCSSTTIERLEEFSLRYLNAYLPYAGDLYHSGFSFWADLSEMIVRHGELEDRLVAARSGFGFGNTRSIEIVDHTVNLCVDFKDGHYLVDILYRTETVGLQGPVQEDNRVRLLLWEENERLFAEAMYHY